MITSHHHLLLIPLVITTSPAKLAWYFGSGCRYLLVYLLIWPEVDWSEKGARSTQCIAGQPSVLSFGIVLLWNIFSLECSSGISSYTAPKIHTHLLSRRAHSGLMTVFTDEVLWMIWGKEWFHSTQGNGRSNGEQYARIILPAEMATFQSNRILRYMIGWTVSVGSSDWLRACSAEK